MCRLFEIIHPVKNILFFLNVHKYIDEFVPAGMAGRVVRRYISYTRWAGPPTSPALRKSLLPASMEGEAVTKATS